MHEMLENHLIPSSSSNKFTSARRSKLECHIYKQKSMHELAEIGRHGHMLARVIEGPLARELFRLEMMREMEKIGHRLRRLPDFLSHLQRSTERLTEKLKERKVAE